MWTCPKCDAEVDDGFEICWACGTSFDGIEDPKFNPQREGIMSDADYRQSRATRTEERMVTVATFHFAHEAHVVRSQLEAEGIAAFVADEFMSAEAWEMYKASGGVNVQVSENDAVRASRILADLERNGPAEVPEESASAEADERIQKHRPALWEDKNRQRE
jgi:hypothetical protein